MYNYHTRKLEHRWTGHERDITKVGEDLSQLCMVTIDMKFNAKKTLEVFFCSGEEFGRNVSKYLIIIHV